VFFNSCLLRVLRSLSVTILLLLIIIIIYYFFITLLLLLPAFLEPEIPFFPIAPSIPLRLLAPLPPVCGLPVLHPVRPGTFSQTLTVILFRSFSFRSTIGSHPLWVEPLASVVDQPQSLCGSQMSPLWCRSLVRWNLLEEWVDLFIVF